MTDSMLPIIRQMHEAEDDRARARILLQVPDAALAKYRDVFQAACRRASFDVGLLYIDSRLASWQAVRAADGTLPPGPWDDMRVALAGYALGVEP